MTSEAATINSFVTLLAASGRPDAEGVLEAVENILDARCASAAAVTAAEASSGRLLRSSC